MSKTRAISAASSQLETIQEARITHFTLNAFGRNNSLSPL
uniref:Uncharacterized protein n=1 Tax=Arundo donax TaxID=35708 RepID=A0A0A8Y1B8_ARUDO